MTQSPELAGGAGFTFEDTAVAIYLAALLGEETAPALGARVVVRVASQQAASGEPLDDLIVDGRGSDEEPMRLSLQVKRQITISASSSNTDFRGAVARAYATTKKEAFRNDIDRVGVVTGTVADRSKRALETVCEWARDSATTAAFMARFAPDGTAGSQHREVVGTFRAILAANAGDDGADVEVHHLLRHFVLVKFDLLHEGSRDEANTINRLRSTLNSDQADQAAHLWHRLRVIAREAAGRAAEFDRHTLLGRLVGSFRFAGAHSLRQDLERLAQEAKRSLRDIAHDIGGFRVTRSTAMADAEEQLRERRFLQIAGLPGCGKSAILRELAESRLSTGSALVIKSDRIIGPNWAAYAQTLSVKEPHLDKLLMEIAAVGTPIVFVDGLDRIEIQHRGVVLDVINTILASPDVYAAWRIVATVRDTGMGLLRTWLPPALVNEGAVWTLTVMPFDDGEAKELAAAKPELWPLLFGDERIREIARRPFFAAVLARSVSACSASGLVPRSEMELVDAWWMLGGCHGAVSNVARRQRALVQLAKAGATTLGRRISVDEMDIDVVGELKQDGILREARAGHTVCFAHDIFFEWAFVQLLIAREDRWPEEIRAVGEPPVLGRAVELLSQATFVADDWWAESLGQVERAPMRSQWTRAWLLGPMGAVDFLDRSSSFADAVFRDDGQRLKKMLVWLQAEKTRPNPVVISAARKDGSVSEWEIGQAADAYALPYDFQMWIRACTWILDNVERCPVQSIPDIVSVFEVWQNALANFSNTTSERILEVSWGWLEDIEDRLRSENFRADRGQWKELGNAGLEELEARLRALVLRAGRAVPKWVGGYLERVGARRRLRRDAFKQVLLFAPILSETHASNLVDLTLLELKDALPADVAARPSPHGVVPTSVSYHDWDHLAVERGGQRFFPPSPLREPFASLFLNAPNEAQRLVRDLTNHAIKAWRQLFSLDWQRRATPIPLTLDFPWGQQTFWGNAHVYGWFRGGVAPHAVAAGLMALEHWAFTLLERGRDVDEVIREVVAGHESVAVLGIAVALALTGQRISRTTLPLAVAQHLWHWDLNRFVQESSSNANLIEFMNPADRRYAEAVREGNAREVRRLELRQLAPLFVLSADGELRNAAQAAIQDFPEKLPFEFEEEKHDQGRLSGLRRTAEIWAEYGREENYKASQTEDAKGIYVTLENPKSNDPDVTDAAERHAAFAEQLMIRHWARECFEHGRISDRLPLSEALDRAKCLDAVDLFAEPHGDVDLADNSRGAVAGVAAVALCFCDKLEEPDLAWAREVAFRAAATPERRDELWFSGAVLLWHPCLSAASGLAALIRRGIASQDAKRALLELGGHPREQVSQAAIGAALGLWGHDPEFAWAALNLGLGLSVGTRRGARISAFGFDHTSHREYVAQAVEGALAELESPEGRVRASLNPIPKPWVFAPPPREDSPLGGETSLGPRWRDPDVFLRWDFLPKVLAVVPVERVMSDTLRRPAFLSLCDDLVAWTIERLEPSWQQDGEAERLDRRSANLIEWRSHLYNFLARVALCMEVEEGRRRFLEPAFALDDELAMSMVRPFADIIVCSIMDAPKISEQAIKLVDTCVDRVLVHRDWDRSRRRHGDIYGFDLPGIVRILLFVQIEHAGRAARFANGDWKDVERILPIIDRVVCTVGDIPLVTLSFLTVCARAVDHYSPECFVEQTLAILGKQPGVPTGWRGSIIPARIAALVQAFAEHTQPLPLSLAQDMLRILDKLVDMGDRRSAALQTSEIFKDIKIG